VTTGQVRPVRPQDLEAVHGMVRDLADFERSLPEVTSAPADFSAALFAADPKLFGHVVEHDDGLGGFALWFLNFSTWTGRHGIYLEDLYVRPELRGRGYGRALLVELARTCIERGYTRLEWWVLDWNRDAQAFYRSVDAVPMDQWTVNRLTGPALGRLAAPDRGASPPIA
jgi:GNAT superfamily N-acetyltransferase